MLDRRHFLIGVGNLLTATFVRKATAFSQATGRPLILPAAKAPEEALFIYEVGRGESPYGSNFYDEESDELPFPKWRVTLGPDDPLPPPTPTWGEYLRDLGYQLESPDEIRRAFSERHVTPEQLNAKVDGYWWQDRWDNFTGPQAKAFHLLKELQVGAPPDSRLRQAGELVFDELGGSPCNVYKSVHLKDDLTASLLQARLVELNLPIKVKVGPLS
jgi:hypothetical protein